MEPSFDLTLVKEDIRNIFLNDYSGHDYWHSERVCINAERLADIEGAECDRIIISLAALLHDVDDPKLFETEKHHHARMIMNRSGINREIQQAVLKIIDEVSFKGAESTSPDSIEGKIVQDADRLDALGAIGIARTFAYGGSMGHDIYDPENEPLFLRNYTDYIGSRSSSVSHFYEKLFLLKDMMNTDTARKIAEKREKFMRDYLDEFYREWEGI